MKRLSALAGRADENARIGVPRGPCASVGTFRVEVFTWAFFGALEGLGMEFPSGAEQTWSPPCWLSDLLSTSV